MSAAREESPNPENVTAPLVSAGASDRCPVCGAHLAVDQRYCVDCGTRRGAPRFQLAGQSPAAAGSPVPAASGTGGVSRLTRVTSGTALLVTVLIILVAVGVGVLIGHDGSNHNVVAGTPRVVVNETGGGAGSSVTGNSGATGSSGASASTSSGSTAKSKSPKATKATKAAAAATNPNASAKGKAATSAAAKSFSKSATDKSTVGGSCTAGTAGCSGGKQTGNLF